MPENPNELNVAIIAAVKCARGALNELLVAVAVADDVNARAATLTAVTRITGQLAVLPRKLTTKK